MPGYYARLNAATDANQAEIVADLRKAGLSVALTHRVGFGFPDLVVGYYDRDGERRNVLFEIKMPGESLNKKEKEFFAEWAGPVYKIESTEDALRIIMGIT